MLLELKKKFKKSAHTIETQKTIISLLDTSLKLNSAKDIDLNSVLKTAYHFLGYTLCTSMIATLSSNSTRLIHSHDSSPIEIRFWCLYKVHLLPNVSLRQCQSVNLSVVSERVVV